MSGTMPAVTKLTPTTFVTLPNLENNPRLTSQVIALENTAFTRLHIAHASNWKVPTLRFSSSQRLFDIVGQDGVLALILDESRTSSGDLQPSELVQVHDENSGSPKEGKLVACAIIVPWAGGLENEGAGTETGWEAKAVAVDEDERYLKKGIAIRLIKEVGEYLLEKEGKNITTLGNKEPLTLWVLAGEELNGEYWRRRGFVEVRRKLLKSPLWDCLGTAEAVVLKRELRA